MTKELHESKTLPSRRELRLARQAAENAEKSAKEMTLKAEVEIANAVAIADTATQAIPLVKTATLNTKSERERFNAKFHAIPAKNSAKDSSFLKKFVQKSPALSAVALAGVLVFAGAGVMNSQNAVGEPNFNLSDSVLGTVSANKDDVKRGGEELKPTQGAAEITKIIETQIAANSGKLRCNANGGANNLSTAYVQPVLEQVFFPMETGTYRISSPFGLRANPTGGGTEFHTGIDFAAPQGSPIYAAADGEVVMDGSETPGNNDIRIKHEVAGKVFYTWYLHCYRTGIFVKAGQKVKAGEKIAEVGNSGRSTGSHLHFEIRPTPDYSQPAVNPVEFISKLGAVDITQKCD